MYNAEFSILRTSLTYWRNWVNESRIHIFLQKNKKSCPQSVCERERIGGKTGSNIFHLTHLVWPPFSILHWARGLLVGPHWWPLFPSGFLWADKKSPQETGGRQESKVCTFIPLPSVLEVCLQLKVTGLLHDSLPSGHPPLLNLS